MKTNVHSLTFAREEALLRPQSLGKKLTYVPQAEHEEDTVDNAHQLLSKLKMCITEFKESHLAIIDFINEEDTLIQP